MKHIYKSLWNDIEKHKIVEKLNRSDKYEEIFHDSKSARNDYSLASSNITVYYSKYFNLWVVIIKTRNRKGKLKTFDFYKTNENPIEKAKQLI